MGGTETNKTDDQNADDDAQGLRIYKCQEKKEENSPALKITLKHQYDQSKTTLKWAKKY